MQSIQQVAQSWIIFNPSPLTLRGGAHYSLNLLERLLIIIELWDLVEEPLEPLELIALEEESTARDARGGRWVME